MSVERIATLEAHLEAERGKLDELTKKVDSVDGKLDEVITTLDKQKGFIAGAMFILLPIWSAILLFAKSAWTYITVKGDV